MQFNDKFIGHDPNSTKLKDGIFYRYNNLGHRCDNVENINLDDYILFVGCSHTEGVGLDVVQTYPHLTSLKLGCSYYNLSLTASGLDVAFYNTLMWLETYKKPRFIVFQYPDSTRFSTMLMHTNNVVPYGSWTNIEEHSKLFVSANEQGLINFRNTCIYNLIESIVDIPILKLAFGTIKADSECIRIKPLDFAIDNLHYGPMTHMNCAQVIVDKYINARDNNDIRGQITSQ